MKRHPETPRCDQGASTWLQNWYGLALGAVWALLLIHAMLPFPANVVVATLSAALGGYLVGRVEGGLGRRRNPERSRHGAPLLVFLLVLLGLSLFAFHVVNIAWAPPLFGLVAFIAACAVGRCGR